jgi:hypothetical protein
VSGLWRGPGSAPPLFVAGEAPLLRADEQVFEAGRLVGAAALAWAFAPRRSTAADWLYAVFNASLRTSARWSSSAQLGFRAM